MDDDTTYTPAPEPHTVAMTESELLTYMGTDAQRWAAAWCRIARDIDRDDHADERLVIDEGWMIGWFANAIEAGRNAGAQHELQP